MNHESREEPAPEEKNETGGIPGGAPSLDYVSKLVELVREGGVGEVRVRQSQGELEVVIKAVSEGPAPPRVPESATPTTSEPTGSEPEKVKLSPEEEGLHSVRAPLVGTFYRASGPGESPYVEVGDRIEAGQTICIVEAMKLMNEVPSEVTGEVVEVLVENGHTVEYNQPLFYIRSES